MRIYSVYRDNELIAAYPKRKKAERIRDKLTEKYPDNWYCVDVTTFIGSDNHTEESEIAFLSETMYKRWSTVVCEFLAKLSTIYGYTIDEYDMAGMVHHARLDRLGKIVNLDDHNSVATREFIQVTEHVMYWQRWAVKNRNNAREVYEAMKPITDKTKIGE